MKLNQLKRISVVILIPVLSLVIIYHLFWIIQLHEVPKEIRPSLKAVLKEYYISKITGSYWENEMAQQAENIKSLPKEIRILFYRNIIMKTCHLDTSRALTFFDLLGEDSEALLKDLKQLRNSSDFLALSEKQQKQVNKVINCGLEK